MARKIRVKSCDRCNQKAPVPYRVRYEESGHWFFVCPQCWLQASHDNPFYVYGGTWKARKRG